MRPWFYFMLALGTPFFGWAYTVSFPTAPAAGLEGSTAIPMSSDAWVGWADGATNLVFGEGVDAQWLVASNGLGAAQGTAFDVVCLGRGGQITLTFSQGISDGDGFDFAVFENSFSDTFLELAWVEVSSDGIHFVRFPAFSDTSEPVGSFGTLNAFQVYGFAGKYRQGYGTPFDLSELGTVSNSIAAGEHALTEDYVSAFQANMPFLDSSNVRFVRLVDVVGDGTALDCEGYTIYDPYPTVGSAGFDLDAVGVLHSAVIKEPQHIFFAQLPNILVGGPEVSLRAYSSQGLPVSVTVSNAPVGVTVDDALMLHVGDEAGEVTLRAYQAGNATVAPAAAVLVSFDLVEAGATNAPESFTSWQLENPLPKLALRGIDGGAVELMYVQDRTVSAWCQVLESAALQQWTNSVPEIMERRTEGERVFTTVRLSVDSIRSFYRLGFDAL